MENSITFHVFLKTLLNQNVSRNEGHMKVEIAKKSGKKTILYHMCDKLSRTESELTAHKKFNQYEAGTHICTIFQKVEF